MQKYLPTLKHIYPWATVKSFEVGPRREITLYMKLWRDDVLNRHEHNWKENREPATIVPVRFGGVENLEEVQAFFERVKAEITKLSPDAIEPIGVFDYDREHESKINEIYFRVYFDRSGDKIIIRCQSVTEREAFFDSEDQ